MSERTRLSAVRAEVATALASKDDLRGILNKCADAVVRHLDAAFARIWTLKHGGGELELQASAGYTQGSMAATAGFLSANEDRTDCRAKTSASDQ